MYILSSEKSTILNNESSHLQQLLFPCEKLYSDCLLKIVNILKIILYHYGVNKYSQAHYKCSIVNKIHKIIMTKYIEGIMQYLSIINVNKQFNNS